MARLLSWLAVGVAAASLVVAYPVSLASIISLAFAIRLDTLVVTAGIAYSDRGVRRYSGADRVISAWTIVPSLVFSRPTVQNLAVVARVSGRSAVGLTTHEVSFERASRSRTPRPSAKGDSPRPPEDPRELAAAAAGRVTATHCRGAPQIGQEAH
ncbi:MAG: hypothetical protein ACRDPM_19580 [Solirubrobacteraceae bacterium]